MYSGQSDRASWVIGNAQEKTADNYITRVLRVFYGKDDLGREGEVASVIIRKTSQDGHEFLDARTILTRYLFDREEVVPGFDDVSLSELSQTMAKDLVEGYTSGRITPRAAAAAPDTNLPF